MRTQIDAILGEINEALNLTRANADEVSKEQEAIQTLAQSLKTRETDVLATRDLWDVKYRTQLAALRAKCEQRPAFMDLPRPTVQK
jgi:hypothetical protein